MFQADKRYMTCGVQQRLPPHLIAMLWLCIVKYMGTLQDKDGQTIEETRLFADLELTRKLIRAFVKEITVGKDNIEIQLNN